MPRRKNMHVAEHVNRASRALRSRFGGLDAAIAAWSDGGSFEEVEIALDALDLDDSIFVPIELPDRPTHEELIQARAVEFVMASQFSRRIGAAASAALQKRDNARDQLIAAVVDRPPIAGYAEAFLRRLQAEGIGQPDLHPASRALAREVAAAIRAYNERRRSSGEAQTDEDEPIRSWSDLPRRFAGFELSEIDAAEYPLPPYPLPPSTEIAHFAIDGHAPLPRATRRDTYLAWSTIIRNWAEANDVPVELNQALIWALLLAHRFNNDGSDVSGFYNQVIVSPWTDGKLAKIQRAEQP